MSACPTCSQDTVHVAIVIPWDPTITENPAPPTVMSRCISPTCIARDFFESPRDDQRVAKRIELSLARLKPINNVVNL